MIFSRFLRNCGRHKHTIKTRRSILGHTHMVYLQPLCEGRSMNGTSVSIIFMVISFRKQRFCALSELMGSHAWSPARETRSGPHPYQILKTFFDLGRSNNHIGRPNVSPAGADEKSCFLAAFCAIAVDSSTQSKIGENWLRALVWFTSSQILKV